jgi:Tetracyclin repressor-like, C-terminal domain
MSCVAGMALARYVLELPGLAGADRTDVERLLRPALEALLGEAD